MYIGAPTEMAAANSWRVAAMVARQRVVRRAAALSAGTPASGKGAMACDRIKYDARIQSIAVERQERGAAAVQGPTQTKHGAESSRRPLRYVSGAFK